MGESLNKEGTHIYMDVDHPFFNRHGSIIGLFEHSPVYHKSWDWLMPVVEKIEMLDCVLAVTISTNEVTIESMNEEFTFIEVIRWEDKDSIRGVYKAVVEFIEWYNKNK